jgi:hypothetical protein
MCFQLAVEVVGEPRMFEEHSNNERISLGLVAKQRFVLVGLECATVCSAVLSTSNVDSIGAASRSLERASFF